MSTRATTKRWAGLGGASVHRMPKRCHSLRLVHSAHGPFSFPPLPLSPSAPSSQAQEHYQSCIELARIVCDQVNEARHMENLARVKAYVEQGLEAVRMEVRLRRVTDAQGPPAGRHPLTRSDYCFFSGSAAMHPQAHRAPPSRAASAALAQFRVCSGEPRQWQRRFPARPGTRHTYNAAPSYILSLP